MLTSYPLAVALATWSPIIVELLLAAALFLPRRQWHNLLTLGIIFHLSIAVLLGLWTFSASMIAALVLYLHPAEQPLRVASCWLSSSVAKSLPVRIVRKSWDAAQLGLRGTTS